MQSSSAKPVLIYTTHKAASMFLHNLTEEIARELDMNYYSINPTSDTDVSMFKEIMELSWKEFIQKYLAQSEKRACFGTIRTGEARPSIPDNIANYSVILHLRDPRDVLTSLFFSHTFSHKVHPDVFNPGKDLRKKWANRGIDDFVIKNSDNFLDHYEYGITNLLGRDNVIFLKYEDMVADYHTWLTKFLSAFTAPDEGSSVDEPRGGITTLLEKLRGKKGTASPFHTLHQKLYAAHKDDFSVNDEDIYRHRRQILPGDHQRKLQPETIALLNEKFSHVLDALGYA